MIFSLQNRTALVTGGSTRIGRLIVESLADKGCNVLIHYHNSAKEAKQLCFLIQKQYGVSCKSYKLDFSSGNEQEIISFWEDITKENSQIDILINSASLFERCNLKKLNFPLFKKLYNINFIYPAFLSSLFAKYFEEKKLDHQGQIINILDCNIATDRPAFSAYLLAKKNLEDFTKMAALDFAPTIKINAIAPGLMKPKQSDKKLMLDRINSKIPLKKNYEERQRNFITTLLFLLQNEYISGETIFVDGGEHLRR